MRCSFPLCASTRFAAIGVAWAAALVAAAPQAGAADLAIGYLRHQEAAPPTLSNLDPTPEDLGLAGARLGLADIGKTGRFLGAAFTIVEGDAGPEDDPLAAARAILAETRTLVVDAPAETLLAVADLPEAEGALILNAGAEDDALRSGACRGNVLHTAVSYAMRADALAQMMVFRRWTDWALILGERPRDAAFAAALRRSGAKFGLTLVGEKTWAFDADMRRAATTEAPVFTQDLGEHDLLVVADEIHDFGRYLPYNTWLPRPVAGSEGLRPLGWAGVVEQWGAAQLQGRFRKSAGREMRARDYAAWAAFAALGEAAIRSKSAEAADLRAYMLSDAFELAGFKGRPLTFRSWNGQMRQPVALVHARALAALAPLEGFLHQRNELDTLGLDAPESACAAFAPE